MKVELFSTDCSKTKTNVITPANQVNQSNLVNQSKLEVNTCSRRGARENECERDSICFGFTSDWLKMWREFFKPIVYSVVIRLTLL